MQTLGGLSPACRSKKLRLLSTTRGRFWYPDLGLTENSSPVWKKEDGQINGRHFQQGNTLYVKNAQRKDAGVYICQGINSRGNVIFEYRAVVTISGRSPCLLSLVSTVL